MPAFTVRRRCEVFRSGSLISPLPKKSCAKGGVVAALLRSLSAQRLGLFAALLRRRV
jgi:hypothetical protein